MIREKRAPDLIRGGCRFSEKIMRNNKLKRNDGSTPFRVSIMIAANPHSGQPRLETPTRP